MLLVQGSPARSKWYLESAWTNVGRGLCHEVHYGQSQPRFFSLKHLRYSRETPPDGLPLNWIQLGGGGLFWTVKSLSLSLAIPLPLPGPPDILVLPIVPWASLQITTTAGLSVSLQISTDQIHLLNR